MLIFSLYQSKNFNLDALRCSFIEGDPDLKYLREVNKLTDLRNSYFNLYSCIKLYGKRNYSKSSIIKIKIEKLTWVDSVITVIDVPLLKSTDEGLMERLKNYKTLAYPEINRERGFEEIINSPIIKTMSSAKMVKHLVSLFI